MKVICKKNTAKDLDLNKVTSIISNEAEFALTLEKEYIVMGIEIYQDSNCIYYLVDEYDLPSWKPYMLFEISNNELPPDWYVNIIDSKKPQTMDYFTAGFYELCNYKNYYNLLFDKRDEKALETYFKRKQEIQEWHWEQEFRQKTKNEN